MFGIFVVVGAPLLTLILGVISEIVENQSIKRRDEENSTKNFQECTHKAVRENR